MLLRVRGEARALRIRIIALFTLFAIAPVFACGTLLSISSDNPAPPAAANDAGSSSTTTTPPSTIDLDANVADCTGRPATTPTDLYVTSDGLATAACTMIDPCALDTALTRAKTAPLAINLGPGTYEIDLVLPPNTRVNGGWTVAGSPHAWTPVCDQRLVTIAAVHDVTVQAIDAPNTALSLLTIVSSKSDPAPTATRIGVLARGSTTTLTLDNVAVSSGRGGDGVAGDPPSPLPPVMPLPCDVAGDGVAGSPGNAGTPSSVSFTENGVVDVPGSGGTVGSAGQTGTPGGAGEVRAGLTCTAGDTTCTSAPCSDQGSPGTPGCGGIGGQGGLAGQTGGGSIGVFAWSGSTITVRGGLFGTQNGGAGGAGSPGNSGVPGTNGTQGVARAASCAVSCDDFATGCVGTVGGTTLGGGAPGGAGGAGGAGGQGGGGSGGPAFAFIVGGDAGVTLSSTAKVTHLSGGDGGAPNGLVGLSGDRGP